MAARDDVYNVALEIKEAIVSPPRRPKEIFTCAACDQPIIAYGDRGVTFVTVKGKHFHNDCAPPISEVK